MNYEIQNYQILQFDQMRYIVKFPAAYTEGEKLPIILFLHGAGSRGDDINKIINNPYFTEVAGKPGFPFISIVPQCYENTWFDIFQTLKRFVFHILQEEYADINRIYVMGVSMGGYAAWQLAMSLPECFAALLPVCGGGMYWNADRLKNVPVWAFHGAKDIWVCPKESKKMVEAVNKCGGSAKLTVYPEAGHDAWTPTYRNPEVFEWLLEHENQNNLQFKDIYKDNQIFG